MAAGCPAARVRQGGDGPSRELVNPRTVLTGASWALPRYLHLGHYNSATGWVALWRLGASDDVLSPDASA